MLQFFIANLTTIVVSILLLVMVVAIIRKMIRDKKQGKGCCPGSSGCDGCCHTSSDTSCHH